MNTSMFESRRFLAARLRSALGAMALLVSIVAVGCKGGSEGDRCNPILSHDECGGDTLVCSGPSTSNPLPGTCVENYCCPKDPSKSTDPHCNGPDSPNCPVAASGDDDTGASDGGDGDGSTAADTSTGSDTSTGDDTGVADAGAG